MQESKQEVTKVVSLVNMAENLPGPSYSKLTMPLVNVSLKFLSLNTACTHIFAEKCVRVALHLQKLLTFFSAKIPVN